MSKAEIAGPAPGRKLRGEGINMTRQCGTCQHVKRAEIDRRLAAGEAGSQIARDYRFEPFEPAPASDQLPGACLLQPHHERGGRGTAAVALLPSKETL